MQNKEKASEVAPYSALATYYDQVMEHVNYHQWANFIKILFRYSRRSVRRVADISCGTGSLLRYLGGLMRKAYGFDLSPAMLKVAKNKLVHPRLACASFLHLPLKPLSMDCLLSLYDSVNYLQNEEEVALFLEETYRAIKPGGLLIFDVVTPYLCRTAFKHYEEDGLLDEDNRYRRTSFFQEDTFTQVNQFEIWINGRHFFEEHRQKIFEIEQWAQMIGKSRFKLLHIFSNFSLNPAHERSERAHFVLLKNSSGPGI